MFDIEDIYTFAFENKTMPKKVLKRIVKIIAETSSETLEQVDEDMAIDIFESKCTSTRICQQVKDKIEEELIKRGWFDE